jgi:hypothetical protein
MTATVTTIMAYKGKNIIQEQEKIIRERKRERERER